MLLGVEGPAALMLVTRSVVGLLPSLLPISKPFDSPPFPLIIRWILSSSAGDYPSALDTVFPSLHAGEEDSILEDS